MASLSCSASRGAMSNLSSAESWTPALYSCCVSRPSLANAWWGQPWAGRHPQDEGGWDDIVMEYASSDFPRHEQEKMAWISAWRNQPDENSSRRVTGTYLETFKNMTVTQQPYVMGRACTLKLDKCWGGSSSPLVDLPFMYFLIDVPIFWHKSNKNSTTAVCQL
jgi:hypothetical protein